VSSQFKTETIAGLSQSGWARCPSVAEAVGAAGLPAVTPTYLQAAFGDETWDSAEASVAALRTHFASARFAEEAEYGVLLVPDPAKLDTRRSMPTDVREDQLATPGDVFDPRLPDGALPIPAGTAWTMVATITGPMGISLGSYQHITGATADAFTVLGTDTRTLMTRQIWGARVLQSGSSLPDSSTNQRWTFTLFPGEPLTDEQAESGTVLHGRVRFRLGRPDRAIGPARVTPTLRC
jgi:hypothetical protein